MRSCWRSKQSLNSSGGHKHDYGGTISCSVCWMNNFKKVIKIWTCFQLVLLPPSGQNLSSDYKTINIIYMSYLV